MGTRKLAWGFLVILATTALVLGSATQARADTLKYKMYNYSIKEQGTPVGDEEGHFLGSFERAGFCVFENGEVARNHVIGTAEAVKGGVSTLYYQIITFSDGSTIVSRVQGTIGGGARGPCNGRNETRHHQRDRTFRRNQRNWILPSQVLAS